MNTKKPSLVNFSLCFLLLTISGCARYKAYPLKILSIPSSMDDKSVTFAYKIFNKKDCIKYLGRNVIKKGYQPVQLTIHNNSAKMLSFSLATFTLPCAPIDLVRNKVHFSTIGRVLAYSPGVILSASALSQMLVPTGFSGLMLLQIGGILLVSFIAATVDCVASVKANRALDADYTYKALHDQILYPACILNGIIFISLHEFDENFSFSLRDSTNTQMIVLSTYQPH